MDKPVSFESIVGNDNLIKGIQTAIERNTVSHAYIIDGSEGAGKSLLASMFAKTLQCEKGGISPCCECISCKTFDSGNHPDIFYPHPTKTKALGVDDVREQINKQIEIKPYKYKYKIFIVEQADEMTVQAQNALLKTLEEPPHYGTFFLLAENSSSFLSTIRSRCVYYKIKPVPLNLIKDFLLKNLGLPEDKAHLFAACSQGSIGQAQKLVDSEQFISMRNSVVSLLKDIHKNDLVYALSSVKQLESYKENIQDVLDVMFLFYRDVAVYQAEKNEKSSADKFILQRDIKDEINVVASGTDLQATLYKLDSIWQTKRFIKRNANFSMAMDCLLLRLSGVMKG